LDLLFSLFPDERVKGNPALILHPGAMMLFASLPEKQKNTLSIL
jgi:hypothetical protein